MIQVLREHHEVSPQIQEILTRAGGVNWYGEPNFRAVWGYSRMGWIGGKWIDRDANGNVIRECFQLRRVPKYLPQMWNRWIIESYRPPEFYGSRWLWNLQTRAQEKDENGRPNPAGLILPALGDYPSRGDYEHSHTVEKACAQCLADYRNGNEVAIKNCEHWEFVQLTPFVADKIARMIMFCRAANEVEQRLANEAQAAREMALEDMAAEEIADSAQSYQIPKDRKDYLERFVVPAIERQLARGMKRRQGLSPETLKVLDRGRSAALPLVN
jgi:hypothetical protein